MQLRKYQIDLINKLRHSFKIGHKRPICVAGCGVGKTVLATFMCSHHNGYVWFLVHRRELIEQTINTFENGVPDNVFVGMVQTVTRHLNDYKAPTLIIIDECHHSTSKTYLNIINNYPDVPVVGLTATPARLDGKPLGEIFDDMVFSPDINWMINHNYLAPFKYYAPKLNLLNAEWKIKGSDYDMTDAAEKLDKPGIYGDILKYIDVNRKTIIYCPNIDYSMKLSEKINSSFKWPVSAHFDGNTSNKDRHNIVNAFRNGNIRVLLNVDLVGEGFDVPDCDCCILLRPTMSVSLYIQQSMRCMRYRDNKTAIIYDLVGNVFKHGMVTEDREWSLNKPVKIRNRTNDKEYLIRECKHCFRVYTGHERICPYCGGDNGLTQRQLKEIEKAELEEIKEMERKSRAKEVGRARTIEELLRIAKERGYEKGWAYRVYNSRKNI